MGIKSHFKVNAFSSYSSRTSTQDPRIIDLVKFMARVAAESDYNEQIKYQATSYPDRPI